MYIYIYIYIHVFDTTTTTTATATTTTNNNTYFYYYHQYHSYHYHFYYYHYYRAGWPRGRVRSCPARRLQASLRCSRLPSVITYVQHMHMYIHIYITYKQTHIYIYIQREREIDRHDVLFPKVCTTFMNSFQTTLTPNPENIYKCHSVAKQAETRFRTCSSNAFELRCRWFDNRSFHQAYHTSTCGRGRFTENYAQSPLLTLWTFEGLTPA